MGDLKNPACDITLGQAGCDIEETLVEKLFWSSNGCCLHIPSF